MSAGGGFGGEAADIARQARSLLAQVRQSRWPAFALPPASAAVPALPAPARTGAAGGWSSLEQVAQAVASCTACALHETRTKTVPGEGSPRARLMFVGEAPGADEDRQGRPFVGKAGQLLDRMIAAMGLSRGEVFIANVLKCRPPANRDPLPAEVAACLPFLKAQVALIGPEVLCSLGKHSAHALLGSREPIGKLRGRFFDCGGRPLMPTFHPSYLLRTPADKAVAWKDLQQLMRRLGLPLPPGESPRAE